MSGPGTPIAKRPLRPVSEFDSAVAQAVRDGARSLDAVARALGYPQRTRATEFRRRFRNAIERLKRRRVIYQCSGYFGRDLVPYSSPFHARDAACVCDLLDAEIGWLEKELGRKRAAREKIAAEIASLG